MGVSVDDLKRDLLSLGVLPGDHVLVHSSLSSLGWVDGGAASVVEAVIRSVGSDGTVLFPTLTGSAELSPENPPVFDASNTPCWTGAIPRAALARQDGIRSLHPTHSVKAFGRLAEWLTADHQYVRTPCGFGSPYDKLADIGGKVLLLGVTQESNTSFHLAEEIAGVPYVLQDRPSDAEVTDSRGQKIAVRGMFLHLYGAERDYCSLEPEMIGLGICRTGTVASADCRLMDALRQREFLVSRLLIDPLAVLAETEKPNWGGSTLE